MVAAFVRKLHEMSSFDADFVEETLQSLFPNGVDSEIGDALDQAILEAIGGDIEGREIDLQEIVDEVISREIESLDSKAVAALRARLVEALTDLATEQIESEVESRIQTILSA